MAIGKNIFTLAERLGYEFIDIGLLESALTHSSYTNEMRAKSIRAESNESLEFLGDAVLQIVISELLFDRYRKQGEGMLTRMRQRLVCEATLAEIAFSLSLGDYINIGFSEEGIGLRRNPKILANTLEAVIAAIYTDDRENRNGLQYTAVILSLFDEAVKRVARGGSTDYKTLLQQFVEKNAGSVLLYQYSECGPEHDKEFTATAFINNNKVGEGKGSTKRNAEMNAAKEALLLFGIIENE